MSHITDYKKLLDEKLHSRIFITDPTLKNSTIFIQPSFSGTLQQLFIVRNWDTLKKTISTEELWAFLKSYEFRQSKLVFDSITGNLIGDKKSEEIYKKYYYNSLWLVDGGNIDIKNYFNIKTLLCIIILMIIFFYIINNLKYQQVNFMGVDGILSLLESTTRAQKW